VPQAEKIILAGGAEILSENFAIYVQIKA